MGSITYDFLKNSFLLSSEDMKENYRRFSDKQLEKELSRYREYCIKNYENLSNEILKEKSDLKVFSSSGRIDFDSLKQSALYINQQVIDDPIFKLTKPKGEAVEVFSKAFGYNNSEKLDRRSIASAAKKIELLTPMIAANYVKIFPISLAFEVDNKKGVPFKYYPNHGENSLPEEIMKFYHKNMKINSLKKEDKGWVVENKVYPSRGIVIGFQNHDFEDELLFHLTENKYEKTDKEDVLTVIFDLPETPPDEHSFKLWVYQSLNQTAKAHFDKIFKENVLASKLGLNYLTSSPFNAELLQQHLNKKQSIKDFTATQFLNMELPFLSQIKTDDLMKVRNEDGEVFETFRKTLEKEFKTLRTISDSEELARKKEDIIHELYDVQVQSINRKMSSLTKKTYIDATLMIGGLTGTIMTGGWSLIATAIAIGRGYNNYSDYLGKVKENPSFFLWKAKQKK
jgi:hypothetical protein